MKNINKEFKYNKKIDTKSKVHMKAHYPKKIWNIPNEKKKGPKI